MRIGSNFTRFYYLMIIIFVIVAAVSFPYVINYQTVQQYFDDATTTSSSRELQAPGFQEIVIERPLPREQKDPKNIKYAAFGSSDTWGAGIIGDRNKLSYPKLLSPDAANFAIRASGPSYPAACTQTIANNNNFDVVILEYFSNGEEGLPTLVRRLRKRFPDAIIIILREWNPLWIENQSGLNTKLWALEHGFTSETSVHDPIMHEAFRSSNDIWKFPEVEKRIFNQDTIANTYGAYILEMEKPSDPRDWVNFHHLIHTDYFHKSNEGHKEVANRIQKLVEKLGVPKNPRQGKWESMDSCNSWFDSGNIVRIKTSPSWKMNRFSVAKKYALELHSDHGSITVNNPSQKPMNIYAAYMITSPAPSYYPKVAVSVFDNEETHKDPIVLKQVGPSYYGYNFVHIHIMEKVGMIPPGRAVLKFTSLEKTRWPFRLVSIAITNEEITREPSQPKGITTWVCQEYCGCFRKGVASISKIYKC